jgi:hypothetical protein
MNPFFRFRDLLWLAVVIVLAVGWFFEHRELLYAREKLESESAKTVTEIGPDAVWGRADSRNPPTEAQ